MAYRSLGLIAATYLLILSVQQGNDSRRSKCWIKSKRRMPSLPSMNARLAELNAIKFHRELAVAAAFDYCAKEDIPAPMWAVREVADMLLRLLMREKTTRRGRTASCIARYKQDHWDVERWDAVEGIRELKRKIRRECKILREYPHLELSHYGQHNEKTRAWHRYGDFECAAMTLSGRDARASAQTMRTSHRKVKLRAGKAR